MALTGEYKTRLGEARLALEEDPDYLSHEQKFTKIEAQVRGELMKRSRSGVVQRALTSHVQKTFPEELIEVRRGARKLGIESELATLDREEDTFSRQAAEAPTPQARDDITNLYEGLLARARDRRFLSPTQYEQKRQSFQHKTLERNMDFLRRTDRSHLRQMDREGAFSVLDPIKRLKILEAARADEDREDTRNDRAFNDAQDAVEREVSALANQGLWPDADIEAALQGKDPFITPDKARQLKTINENPVTGEGSLQIRAVMQEYHGGPSTLGRIAATRKELNRAALELGRPNPIIDKALNELQTDERTMRGVQAQELSAGIKFAEDEVKSRSDLVLPGRLGTIQKNKQASELAELRNTIRRMMQRGISPSEAARKAADEMLKRKQQEKEATPQHRKDIQELDK